MEEIIELTFESPAGIVDCRLECRRTDAGLSYSATILYPDIVNGFSRSEIYCYTLHKDEVNGGYIFDESEQDVHPKIKLLEPKISPAIAEAIKKMK